MISSLINDTSLPLTIEHVGWLPIAGRSCAQNSYMNSLQGGVCLSRVYSSNLASLIYVLKERFSFKLPIRARAGIPSTSPLVFYLPSSLFSVSLEEMTLRILLLAFLK